MHCVGGRSEAGADSGTSRVALVQQGSLSGPGHHQRLALPAQAYGQPHLVTLSHCLLLLPCLTLPCDLSVLCTHQVHGDLLLSPVSESVVTCDPYPNCNWEDEQVKGMMG